MALDIKDRVPTKPNRFLFTPEDGSSPFYAVLSRADEPTQEGTPLNKATLDAMRTAENVWVSDEVKELYGLTEDSNDADHAFKKVISVKPQYTVLLNIENTPAMAQSTVYEYELLEPTKDFDELIIQYRLGLNGSANNTTAVDFSFDSSSFSYSDNNIYATGIEAISTNGYNNTGGVGEAVIKRTYDNTYTIVYYGGYELSPSVSILASNSLSSKTFNYVGKIYMKISSYGVIAGGKIKIIGVKYNEN